MHFRCSSICPSFRDSESARFGDPQDDLAAKPLLASSAGALTEEYLLGHGPRSTSRAIHSAGAERFSGLLRASTAFSSSSDLQRTTSESARLNRTVTAVAVICPVLPEHPAPREARWADVGAADQ